MLDDSVIFLRGAGQEAGDIDEGEDRNLECIAKADEARRLLRGIEVKHPREHQRLVRDDADRAPLDAPEAAEDVALMRRQIGREHGCTPVTSAQLVCRLLLEKTQTS